MNTIEELINMDLDRLSSMSDAEIQTYLADAIKICPPIPLEKQAEILFKQTSGKIRLSPSGSKKTLTPQSELAKKLAGVEQTPLQKAAAMMELIKRMQKK